MELLIYLENKAKNENPKQTVKGNNVRVDFGNNESIRCHVYSNQGVMIFAQKNIAVVSFKTLKEHAPVLNSMILSLIDSHRAYHQSIIQNIK